MSSDDGFPFEFKMDQFVRYVGDPDCIYDGNSTRLVEGGVYKILDRTTETRTDDDSDEGDEGEEYDVDVYYIGPDQDESFWWVSHEELEAWKPAVGDEVVYYDYPRSAGHDPPTPSWIGTQGVITDIDKARNIAHMTTTKEGSYNGVGAKIKLYCYKIRPVFGEGDEVSAPEAKPVNRKRPLDQHKWTRRLKWQIS